jgi:cytochrome c
MAVGVPVPLDIPLPFPALRWNLEVVIVLTFLLHILFVNLMIGGSVLTFLFQLLGRRHPDYDRLARQIGATITVNKSLAVVLGVGPLLAMNALYTNYFYSANTLTGAAWISIVPLVAVAFLITYAHKYSWDRLEEHRGLHIALGGVATLLFLTIPFIFLSNVNLMLFPDEWPDVAGFLSTVTLPNVLPRYLHFIVASLAITGLFLAFYFGRRRFPAEEVFESFDRASLRRRFLALAFGATALQALAGPLLLLTLPDRGLGWNLLGWVTIGVAIAAAAAWLMWREMLSHRAHVGVRLTVIAVLLSYTVLFMGITRHVYRENALEPHRNLVAQRMQTYRTQLLAAKMREEAGVVRKADEDLPPGKRTFQAVCASCHAPDRRLVGPPLNEIRQIYEGKPDQLIDWVKDPGRKREDYPPMPSIRLQPKQYEAVARYVLEPSEPTGT